MRGKQRIIAVLKLPNTVSALQKKAELIVTKMTGNSYFPSPTPHLADINAAVAALGVADTATKTGTKGTREVRELKREALVILLNHTRDFVQAVADGDQANAVLIIESAGMQVKGKTTRKPRVWTAECGRLSGTVVLSCPRAAGRATYFWFYSTDGKTWVAVTPTHDTETTITGLNVGATYWFRYQTLTKAGMSDPSQPLSVVVR